MRVFGDSTEAVKITQPSETPGITVYRASSKFLSVKVSATASHLQCLIFRPPSGVRVEVETVVCLPSGQCSAPYEAYGLTILKGTPHVNLAS